MPEAGGVKVIDISTPVRPDMTVWPEDPSPEFSPLCTHERDGVRVTLLTLGSHTGTHLDAPAHFRPEGCDIHEVDLSRTVGPCRVVDLGDVEMIGAAHLAPLQPEPGERLLFKTRNSAFMGASPFREDFAALDRSAADYLVEREVGLIGIDYLSVERPDSPGFAVHHTLLERGILLLEGLELAHVAPGRYTLVALPLKLEGVEASPLRAVLLQD